VFSGRGTNYYGLYPITYIVQVGEFAAYSADFGNGGISPIESHNIDAKIDDGMPETGTVVATSPYQMPQPPGAGGTVSIAQLIGAGAPSFAATSTLNKCVVSSSGDGYADMPTDAYNLIPSTGGNDNSCALAIRFQ